VSVKSILTYFLVLTVGFHEVSALFGFFLFVILGSQIISGILLAIGYIPEPTLVPIIREEEALESLYTDDLFFLHERGVDYLFIFCYIHLLRKLYIQSYTFEQEAG
jgi:quinol-cytochrome oxidoreductase complex cytochrome b subunit